MIAVIARLKAKAGSEADFESAMLELAGQVREKENGNQLYTLCRDADGGYVMLELYEDEASLAAHRQSDHFKQLGPKLGPFMDGRPQIEKLEVIG
ncbi:MAG: antibiotic biosynthesis monooxygenase [Gammaproteobacteria bacterium]|nr:antibiotic biosynthesis monooxygenase [Gammaproteobacteria bacterium]